MSASFQKPRPKLLEKRAARLAVASVDRMERQKCRERSGGRCEVIVVLRPQFEPGLMYAQALHSRCHRRASQNHHLIGGSGRRNKGRSILADHRLEACDRCHEEITNHVLVPVDGTQRELAATVRYERIK